MSGHPRQQGPPPEGSRGPAAVKGQGAEPRGGAQLAADHGAIVNRNIIRPRRGRKKEQVREQRRALTFSLPLTSESVIN